MGGRILDFEAKRIRDQGFLTGFVYGFSETFAKSFTQSFLSDLDKIPIQKYMKEVIDCYTKTFIEEFVEIVAECRDVGKIPWIDDNNIIKAANIAEKNGRIILLKLITEQKMLTENQAKDFIDDHMLNGISFEEYQGNEILKKAFIDDDCLSEVMGKTEGRFETAEKVRFVECCPSTSQWGQFF